MLGTELIDKYRDNYHHLIVQMMINILPYYLLYRYLASVAELNIRQINILSFTRKMVDLLIISFINIGLEIIKANLKHYGV